MKVKRPFCDGYGEFAGRCENRAQGPWRNYCRRCLELKQRADAAYLAAFIERVRMSRADRLVCRIVRLPHGDGLDLPAYQSEGAAGMDLLAALAEGERVVLEPGDRRLIPCGLKIQIPLGYEAQVRPRSGHALKQGITVLNAPGTIDSDYTGEVGVLLINHGRERVGITRGLRIAQLVVGPVARVLWDEVGSLEETARGAAGFGSTGDGAPTLTGRAGDSVPSNYRAGADY